MRQSGNIMASLRDKLSPSAVTVLTAMLFWGQVQNYMMRVNLREAKMDSHHRAAGAIHKGHPH